MRRYSILVLVLVFIILTPTIESLTCVSMNSATDEIGPYAGDRSYLVISRKAFPPRYWEVCSSDRAPMYYVSFIVDDSIYHLFIMVGKSTMPNNQRRAGLLGIAIIRCFSTK